MDHSKLSPKRDKDIIIPRALFATNSASFNDDISKLERLYTSKEIIAALKSTKELIANEVCLLVAERYHIKKFLRFSK